MTNPLRIAFAIFALLLFALCTQAQSGGSSPHLFDSFGALKGCDASARLDNFYIEVRRDPTQVAYVIAYGPEGEGSGTGRYLLTVIRRYLEYARGLEMDRVYFIYGGRYQKPAEIFTEIYVLPFGAPAPVPHHYNSKLPLVSGKYQEFSVWDGVGEGDGPSFGNVGLAAFADHLREQPNYVAYAVAYSLPDSVPGAWRRIAKRELEYLEELGISGERLKLLYGGPSKKRDNEESDAARLQLWILPSDAPPPIKAADPESSPKEATMIGSYFDMNLAEHQDERRAFEAFADFLRADSQMNVCFILHPRVTAEEPGWWADQPKADLAKLIEQWRSELREKFGVAANRISVLTATTEETEGTIDVWVLPVDAPLPDPFPTQPDDEDVAPLDSDPEEPSDLH